MFKYHKNEVSRGMSNLVHGVWNLLLLLLIKISVNCVVTIGPE